MRAAVSDAAVPRRPTQPALVAGLAARVRAARPRAPRRVAGLCALAAVALATLYFAWLRDSSLASVDRVEISGLPGAGAARVRAELSAAARRMTTLDVDTGALRSAVSREPLVHSLRATGAFPHTLRIAVVPNVPVARLVAGRRTVAVAGDGTLLPTVGGGALPAISVRAVPPRGRIRDAGASALIAAAAAAPGPLRPLLAAVVSVRGTGIVARLRGGAALVLGDTRALAAKWAAAAAVLAQPSSAGATYVDVRSPARPIAGGLGLPDQPQPTPEANPTAPGSPGVLPATATGASGGQPAAPSPPSAISPPASAGVNRRP